MVTGQGGAADAADATEGPAGPVGRGGADKAGWVAAASRGDTAFAPEEKSRQPLAHPIAMGQALPLCGGPAGRRVLGYSGCSGRRAWRCDPGPGRVGDRPPRRKGRRAAV